MAPQAFIFFGKSGSGKGTQARLLVQYLEESTEQKVVYIETGTQFREFIRGDTTTAAKVKNVIDKGELVPEFIPIWMWSDALLREVTGKEYIVFDGVARRPSESPVLDSAMRFYGYDPVRIINIDVSDEWAREMMMGRGRKDDTEDEIKKRLAWYEHDVVVAMRYFKDNSLYNFVNVNGEQSIKDVHEDIVRMVDVKL